MNIQDLLNIIRPKVSGRSQASRSRFQTSDVTQECAVQLIKEFRKREAEGVEPQVTKTWLTKIGRGTASKLRRQTNAQCRSVARESYQAVHRHTTTDNKPDDLAISKEIQSMLVFALTRLSSEENEVIDLRFNHNQTISAIARHMDLPRHQIQKIHDEALDKIRQDLESK